jgi:hypothetical protein
MYYILSEAEAIWALDYMYIPIQALKVAVHLLN